MTRFVSSLMVLMALLPAASAFEVEEWLVAVQGDDADAQVHLPAFVDTRRQRAIGSGPPPPHGGLLFTGELPELLDVALTLPSGSTVLSSWPAAKSRGNEVSWAALKPMPATNATVGLDWWRQLRGDRPAIGSNEQADSFLFYEARATAVNDYRVEFDKDGTATLSVRPETAAPARAWALRPEGTDWLAAPLTVAQPTAANAAAKPLATILAEVAEKTPDALIEHLGQTIRAALADAPYAALVMLADELPEPTTEILPLPDTHRRYQFVVIVNHDRLSKAEWDALLARLGDPDWGEREAATAAIAELGKTALPHLHRALKDKNLEVIDRAERLILRLDYDPENVGKRLQHDQQQGQAQQLDW